MLAVGDTHLDPSAMAGKHVSTTHLEPTLNLLPGVQENDAVL
jgi:hypothetical protein